MRYKMEFQNLVFQSGLNLTVRKGDKWFSFLKPGDTLSLVKPKGRDIVGKTQEAVVSAIAYIPVQLLPESWLLYEHDPDCRALSGFLKGMEAAYGPLESTDYVTAVFFTVRVPE